MFSKNNLFISTVIFFFLFLHIPHIFSQGRSKSIQVSRIESPPKIDGLIEENCWKNIQPVSGFFQFDPFNGERASEETLVWVGRLATAVLLVGSFFYGMMMQEITIL